MNLPEHSPLGGSAAPRFIKCPGSVIQSNGVEELDDDDFRETGITAHSVAQWCLEKNDDTWRLIKRGTQPGEGFSLPNGDELFVDAEMAQAVQVYLDGVRSTHPDRNQGNSWVERRFHCPQLHKYFYGTADFVHLEDVGGEGVLWTLHVWDYKHGAGIVVEVEENEQCMYYACGALEDLQLWDTVDKVVLHIAQPRIDWHPDGMIREWEIGVDELDAWLHDTLLPAMNTAMVSRETKSGEHCRFCPARFRACPSLVADMEELEGLVEEFEKASPARQYTGPEVARLLELHERSKIVNKAALKTAYHMMMNDVQSVPRFKLAKAKANRIWKAKAEAAARKLFGAKASTAPELKSPAQIDLLPGGKAFTAKWAEKPDKGLTVVPVRDSRPAVDKSVKRLFKRVEKK